VRGGRGRASGGGASGRTAEFEANPVNLLTYARAVHAFARARCAAGGAAQAPAGGACGGWP
jgi:hypothetical protein